MSGSDKNLNTDKKKKNGFLLLKSVLDLLPNPTSIKNSRLERIAVNQAFVTISGYSEDKLLGTANLNISDPETKLSTDFDKQVLSTKEPTMHIEKIRTSENKSRWVKVQKSYFQTDKDKGYVISVLTDITQLKQREFELEASKKRVLQRSLQRSRFLANMGHDIRTPLNGVVGMTEILQNSDLDVRQKEVLELLGCAGNSLMRIIDDIIDFAKIDADVMNVEMSAFSLRKLIEDLAAELGTTARDNSIDLIVSISPNLPDVLIGERTRIQQILMNLIENSLKFTSHGYVLINVSGHECENIVNLEFAIKDTGVGIPPERLKGLFHPIEIDREAERNRGISGLGVSLCQKLANLIGGSLEADSVVGIGSEFKLLLPLKIDPTAETRPTVPTLLQNNKRPLHKVLFVDDIKENYHAMLPYLSALGLTADYTQSAAGAVQLLNNAVLEGSPYTLIFIDYLMPVTDGLLLAGSLRDSQNHSHIKVVALSSVNDSLIQERFTSNSNTVYLTKPIRQRDIETLLMTPCHAEFKCAS